MKFYAFSGKQPAWLDTDQILSLVAQGANKHELYRKKVQAYSEEKESVWEQVKYGFLFGSQSFADSIKEKYLPDDPDRELPQSNELLKSVSPQQLIEQACLLMDCEIYYFQRAERLSDEDLHKRDALVFLLWKTGKYSNARIGELLGMTYSSVSRRLSRVKKILKIGENHPVATNYEK